VTEAAPDWQIADLRQAVDHVRACFGTQRMVWGSDWPVVNLAGGYAKWFAAAEALLADLSEQEKGRYIFGGNAARIYLPDRGRRRQTPYLPAPVACTENLIRVDEAMESPKLAE
jgi:L-fuconolactonase